MKSCLFGGSKTTKTMGKLNLKDGPYARAKIKKKHLKTFYSLNPHDVLCGRGNSINMVSLFLFGFFRAFRAVDFFGSREAMPDRRPRTYNNIAMMVERFFGLSVYCSRQLVYCCIFLCLKCFLVSRNCYCVHYYFCMIDHCFPRLE